MWSLFPRTTLIDFIPVLFVCIVVSGIVWCMNHDSDSDDNDMETEALHAGNRPDSTGMARKVKFAAPWSHSESTVLSMASSYVRELAGDRR